MLNSRPVSGYKYNQIESGEYEFSFELTGSRKMNDIMHELHAHGNFEVVA